MGISSKQFLLDGSKNTVVKVSGEQEVRDLTPLVLLDKLSHVDRHKAKNLKLQKILYSFYGKSGGDLVWLLPENKQELIMPLEGRGKMDFEDFHSIPGPVECIGIGLLATGSGTYMLLLDLEKV